MWSKHRVYSFLFPDNRNLSARFNLKILKFNLVETFVDKKNQAFAWF